MEHRTPPRIVAGDDRFKGALQEGGGQIPLRPFPFVRGQRQIHYRRALLLSVAALAAVALFYLGAQVIRAALNWLHHQPQYQLPFEQIELVPEPPPWFRGGKTALPRGCSAQAREPVSHLDT